MALASQYQTFRTTPKAAALASDAGLHYVTTLVSFKEPAAITKHLSSQAKQLRKKREEVLSSFESQSQLFQEVQTTIEFKTGGGGYLPGLDDNLLMDQEVTLPVLHAVRFSSSGVIEQIRLFWDQAVLLKSIGVIGARASNWPIADGTEQGKLIRASAGTNGSNISGGSSLEETSRQMADVTITSRPTKKINPTNDPHTSLDLFSPPVQEEDVNTPEKPLVAPRDTLRPQDRPWGELFVGSGSADATPTQSKGRDRSPSKDSVASKAGAGKNYGPNRLFEATEGEAEPPSPSKTATKQNPTKYEHFEFYDGHNETGPLPPSVQRPKTKHQSQWDFSDFTTPAKPIRTRGQSQGAHHFSFDDETKEDSPMKKQQHKPRRDAEAHFELQDDGGDADASQQRRAGPAHTHNRNQSSLWQSQTDDGGPDEVGAKSYTQSTVVSQTDRHKDFDPHFIITDDAVVGDVESTAKKPRRVAGIGANVKDRHKDFDAHWAIDDEHPGAVDDQHDASSNRTGLTSNKAKVLQTLSSQWEARDDSSPGTARKGVSGAEAAMFGAGPPAGKENQGIKTSGDGMGGRRGAGRHWGFGNADEDDEIEDQPRKPTGKGGRPQPAARTAFWEELEG